MLMNASLVVTNAALTTSRTGVNPLLVLTNAALTTSRVSLATSNDVLCRQSSGPSCS